MTPPAAITESPTAVALYAAILADPRCDTVRGAFADWLEDNGHAERAEFVRVQCRLSNLKSAAGGKHASYAGAEKTCESCYECKVLQRRERELWHEDGRKWFLDLSGMTHAIDGETNAGAGFVGIVRRGFVAEVRCTMAEWGGGPCGRCEGRGRVTFPEDSLYTGGNPFVVPCRDCHGTGRTPAHGPRIVTEHPVQRAVVTDSESCINEYSTELMPPGVVRFGVSVPVLSEPPWPWPEKLFASREEAVDYLHDLPERLVNWSRREAGLTILEDTS